MVSGALSGSHAARIEPAHARRLAPLSARTRTGTTCTHPNAAESDLARDLEVQFGQHFAPFPGVATARAGIRPLDASPRRVIHPARPNGASAANAHIILHLFKRAVKSGVEVTVWHDEKPRLIRRSFAKRSVVGSRGMRDIFAVLTWWLLIQLIAWPPGRWPFGCCAFCRSRLHGSQATWPAAHQLRTLDAWLAGLLPNSVAACVLADRAGRRIHLGAEREGPAALRDWLREPSRDGDCVRSAVPGGNVRLGGVSRTMPGINSTEKPMEFHVPQLDPASNIVPPRCWLSGSASVITTWAT